MISGWWFAAFLLLIVVGLALYTGRLRKQLRQEASESARLRYRLSSTRHELAEVTARRKKLLAAATQALIIVESDYSISSANKVAKRLFGKRAKEATLMAWTRQHRLQELVEETFRGTKPPPVYFSWEDQHFETRARAIKSDKKVVAVALAVHDVTELEHLSRARRDFITNISHELRTPLASLRLLTDTLLNGVIDEDQEMTRALISKIAIQTDTLSQLAQEILDLSMIESGKLPLKMSPHSLQIITDTEIELLLPQAERKNISLISAVDDDITVLVDEKMVGRVVTNLLHNAIKFTDEGGVKVSARRSNGDGDAANGKKTEGTWVTVSVADTGVGIGPDELPRLFERFYKIDRSRHRQDAGTGLGLAIAKHIVEAHGGHIWAESDGNGATFLFTLPAEDIVSL
jgi:two-component system phosphate regulon sensor histidine kinase PhoR